jgi:hypothetical protein
MLCPPPVPRASEDVAKVLLMALLGEAHVDRRFPEGTRMHLVAAR